MMTFSKYILLDEQARDLQKVYNSTENYAKTIYCHLLKVLFYNDEYNNNKHCNDIDTWVKIIISKKEPDVIPSKEEIKAKLFGTKYNTILAVKKYEKETRNRL